MNTIAGHVVKRWPNRRARASLALEVRLEFLRLLRAPAFAVPTLVFPGLFYLIFGIILGGSKSFQAGYYLLASYCVFGVMAPGLFGFGVVLASEREKGLLMLKRALPMPPMQYLVAKLAMAMLFAAIIVLVLSTLAFAFGGVRLAPGRWLLLGATAVLGVVPFCALGLWIGTRVSASAAPAMINIIYLPMAFLSGLAVPLFLMPKALQAIGPVWPSYHLAQLALAAIGQPSVGAPIVHVGVLAAFAVAMLMLARRRLARDG